MRTKLSLLLTVVISALLMVGCSDSSGSSNLLDKVPSTVKAVAFGNIKTIVESAGGTIDGDTISLPADLMEKIGCKSDIQEFNSKITEFGLNPEAVAIAMNEFSNNAKPFIVFEIKDNAKFVAAIGKEGFEEQSSNSGVTLYSNENASICVSEGVGYFLEGTLRPDVDALFAFISDAKEKSFGSTPFGKYISEGNAGGFALEISPELFKAASGKDIPEDAAEVYTGVGCAKFSLTDDALIAHGNSFELDGSPKKMDLYKKYLDTDAKLSKKALAYLCPEEQLIYAFCLKDVDWDAMLNMFADMAQISRQERMFLPMAKTYLEKINGTVAFGLGLNNGWESIEAMAANGTPSMDEFSATVVIECKKDEAESLMNDIRTAAGAMGMHFADTKNGFNVAVPVGTVYCAAKDNFFVLSTREIQGDFSNPTVSNLNLTNAFAGFGLYLPSNNPFMKGMAYKGNLKVGGVSNGSNSDSEFVVEIKGSDVKGGIIAKAIDFGLCVADKAKQYQKSIPAAASNSADQEVVEEVLYIGDDDEWGE